jgi:putative intracellular protease/amidase
LAATKVVRRDGRRIQFVRAPAAAGAEAAFVAFFKNLHREAGGPAIAVTAGPQTLASSVTASLPDGFRRADRLLVPGLGLGASQGASFPKATVRLSLEFAPQP